MDKIKCELCGKDFRRKKSQILLAKKHYCSIECQNLGRKKGKIIECHLCGKKVYKKIRDINNSKNGKFFCGIECSNKWFGGKRRDQNHPNWVNGKFSYKNILKRAGVKVACNLCMEKDTRILTVHHIDQNRNNNSLGNLAWLCYNCHFLVHNHHQELVRFNNKIKSNANS